MTECRVEESGSGGEYRVSSRWNADNEMGVCVLSCLSGCVFLSYKSALLSLTPVNASTIQSNRCRTNETQIGGSDAATHAIPLTPITTLPPLAQLRVYEKRRWRLTSGQHGERASIESAVGDNAVRRHDWRVQPNAANSQSAALQPPPTSLTAHSTCTRRPLVARTSPPPHE